MLRKWFWYVNYTFPRHYITIDVFFEVPVMLPTLLIASDSDHFILSITKIATCNEATERNAAKISTLGFMLLFVFVIFTII